MSQPVIVYDVPVYNLTDKSIHTFVKGNRFTVPPKANGKAGILATTLGYATQLAKQHPDELTMDASIANGGNKPTQVVATSGPQIDSAAVLAGLGIKELHGVIRYFTSLQVAESDLRGTSQEELRKLAMHAIANGNEGLVLPTGK